MEAMMKDIRDKTPHAYALFETPIQEKELREHMDAQDLDDMVGEMIAESYGFDYIVDPQDISYQLDLENDIPTDDFVELYLFDVIDEDNNYFYLQGEEKDEALMTVVHRHFTQTKVNAFRISYLNHLKFDLTLNESREDILHRQPWLSEAYIAQYMEDHCETHTLKTIIEKRFALGTGGHDTFLERFYEACREIEAEYNIPVEAFDYETTPFKVISLNISKDFGDMAEIFTPYIQRHATIQDFMATDFYHELLDHDFVDYQLQLQIDPEDYQYEE